MMPPYIVNTNSGKAQIQEYVPSPVDGEHSQYESVPFKGNVLQYSMLQVPGWNGNICSLPTPID